MEVLLESLIAKGTSESRKADIVSLALDNCNSEDDARAVVALYNIFGQTALESGIGSLLAKRLEDESSLGDDPLLIFLIHSIPFVRIKLYKEIAQRLESLPAEDEDSRNGLLKLTNSICLNDHQDIPADILNVLWSLIETGEDSTAYLVAKVLHTKAYGQLTESTEYHTTKWWKAIQNRIESTVHGDLPAYMCWLSWAQHGPIQELQKFSQDSQYWYLLQQGITKAPRSTERIKYSLMVMDLTLKATTHALDLELMTWDPKSKTCRALWTRYVAFVEIISVDLSYNQAEDSRDDIFALCQHPEYIAPSWVLALIHSGVTTQAENIRKFVIDTVLDFPDLTLFNHDPTLVVKYLLPLLVDASRFQIKDLSQCKYIETLSGFVSRLLAALKPENQVLFADTLISAYQENVYAFEAPRILVLEQLAREIKKLPPKTLEKVGYYGASARRVAKSQALGWMIYERCLDILASMGPIAAEDVFLIESFFVNEDSYQLIDRIEACITEHLGDTLAKRAQKKAVYYIVYTKFAPKFQWKPRDFVPLEELDKAINNMESSAIDSVKELAEEQLRYRAQQQLQTQKYMDESTMTALRRLNLSVSLYSETLTEPENLELALGQMQSVSVRAAPGVSSEKLLKLLTTNFRSDLPKNFQRRVNALRVKYTIDLIPVSPELYTEVVPLLAEAFSHDLKATRMSVLLKLEQYMDDERISASSALSKAFLVMWEHLDEFGLKAVDRDLHIRFIQTMMHKKLVNAAECTNDIETIALKFVAQSHARKNILCPLARALSQHETLPPWACKVFTAIYTLNRSSHDIFYLEDIILNRYGQYSRFWGESERCARAIAFQGLKKESQERSNATHIAEIILDPTYAVFSPLNYHDGVEENIRILCYQILTLVEPQLQMSYCSSLLPKLITAVDEEASKLARVYIEWLLTRIVMRDHSLISSVILEPLRQSQEPRFVSSLGRAGLLVGKALGDKSSSEYWQHYLNVMIPLCTSNKAAVRHFSVAMVYAVFLDTKTLTKLDAQTRQVLEGIARYASSSEQFFQFKQGDDCVWDINREHTPAGICGGVIQRLYSYDPYITITHAEFEAALGSNKWDSTYLASKSETDRAISTLATVTTIRDFVLNENIQTKSGIDEETIKRGELIVVASLCDIAVNLGAICRLSDALGVKLLTLNDMKVTKSSHFRNTCVTADRWQPMQEVKEDAVAEFLLEQKRNGYTLVGLEQTDNSKILTPKLEFPEKSLLLIGRERQGIPGNLLPLLDMCVEIEQWGVVRSMNVQTATAVIVHAYNHQRAARIS